MKLLKLKGVDSKYVPSEGEIDNLIYLTMRFTIDWTMRAADKAVVLQMAGDVVGIKGISNLVYVACEYTWDHLAGEPEDATVEDYYDHMGKALAHWYEISDKEKRSVTS